MPKKKQKKKQKTIRLAQGLNHGLTGDTQLHKLSRDLGIVSTDDKCHFAIPWARSCQYQFVCNTLPKDSKRFKSYGHFSQTDRGQTTSQTDLRRTGRLYGTLRKSTFSISVGRLSPGRAITTLIQCIQGDVLRPPHGTATMPAIFFRTTRSGNPNLVYLELGKKMYECDVW